jgi:hypothetical protein
MATGSQVTVTTSATAIIAAAGAYGSGYDVYTITNQDASQSVFLGNSGVTTAGYELQAGKTANFRISRGDALYGIVSSGTARVDVLKLEDGGQLSVSSGSGSGSGGTVDTELAAAAALADATANPTVPAVGTMAHVYNGATWDRVRGDIANGLDVDVTRVSGTVTVDSELPAAAALADAAANPTVPAVASFGLIWNGTTWDRAPGTTRGRWIEGAVASGSADSGNPNKVGGKVNTTAPTFVDGNRADLQLSTRGELFVIPRSVNLTQTFQNGLADGVSNSSVAAVVEARPDSFNGSTWDRVRGNLEASLLASSARTTTTNSPDQTNYNGRGVLLVLNVTAQPGGGETLSLKLQAKDSISASYIDVADAGVLFTAATGIKALLVYPGVLAADLVSGMTGKSAVVPRTFRAVVTHSASGSWTYSLSGVTVL